MADTSKYDGQKTGKFVGLHSALIKVTGVAAGTTPTRSGDWLILPEEENYKCKRIIDPGTRRIRTGTDVPDPVYTALEYASMFNQRDADTFELDLSYIGAECLLLTMGHYFRKLTSPLRQWLAVYGVVGMHSGDVGSDDGRIGFTFTGQPNGQDIILGTGGIAYPTGIATFPTPPSAITIPTYTGRVGIYKITDLAA